MLYILVMVISDYGRLQAVMDGCERDSNHLKRAAGMLRSSFGMDISELIVIIPWFWSYLGSSLDVAM